MRPPPVKRGEKTIKGGGGSIQEDNGGSEQHPDQPEAAGGQHRQPPNDESERGAGAVDAVDLDVDPPREQPAEVLPGPATLEVTLGQEQVRDRHDHVAARCEDPGHLLNGGRGIVHQVEGLTAQHDAERIVPEGEGEGPENVRSPKEAIDIDPPYREPRDQLKVRLCPAEEIQYRSGWLRDLLKCPYEGPSEALQMQIVPLGESGLAPFPADPFDLALRQDPPVQTRPRPRLEPCLPCS